MAELDIKAVERQWKAWANGTGEFSLDYVPTLIAMAKDRKRFQLAAAEARQERDAAREENGRLRKALEEWAAHKYSCHIDEEGVCDCGCDDMMAALAREDGK